MLARGVVVLLLCSLYWAGAPATAYPGVEYQDIIDCDAGVVAGEAEPVGTGTCPGVRPGAHVGTPHADGCTFNFVFEGFRAEEGDRVSAGQYIGTAGHCVAGGDYEQVWADGEGPPANDGEQRHIGHVVYGVRLNQQPKRPTGINSDTSSDPVELKHYGQGVAAGVTIPARTAVAGSMPNPDEVFAMGAVTFGDSGSGVISADGRAIGVAVTTGVHAGGPVTHTGNIGITRIGPQIARAGELLGLDLELVTGVTA